jgi:plastocyanin
MRRVALACVLAVALAGVPAFAMDGMGGADGGAAVSIQFAAFAPTQNDVLAGDTVSWTNDSVRIHSVTADDASFTSALLPSGMQFTHRFDAPGSYLYHCTLHPFMRGDIEVHRLLLDPVTDSPAPGRASPIGGRAALPAGTPVTIEADAGTGFTKVATTTVGADGRFSADVVPQTTAGYRASAGGDDSQTVTLAVLDRTVRAVAARHRATVVVSTSVAPPSPGAQVVLQLRLREHFGWWPVASARLNAASRARFTVRTRRALRARVVLVRSSDGATPLATSRVVSSPVSPR